MTFLNFLPHGKHFHVVVGLLNVFMKKLRAHAAGREGLDEREAVDAQPRERGVRREGRFTDLLMAINPLENLTKPKPIFKKRSRNGAIQKTKSVGVNKTNRQLKDAENKVNLSQLAFEQSQEAIRIRQNRFTQGLEKTTDLLQSETQMIQKELEHLQSVFEYNFTKQYLQFLTNKYIQYNFKNEKSKIHEFQFIKNTK
jgi:hypothetical protein